MKNGKCENSNYRFVQMLELQIIFLSSIAIHDISVLGFELGQPEIHLHAGL